MELKIKLEFKNLIPPLSAEEYSGLEKNILDKGCLDAIKVWNGFIIDGHNRYEICNRNGIEFKTREVEFESESDAKIWIIQNQFDRRNLNNYQRGILALKLIELAKDGTNIQKVVDGRRDAMRRWHKDDVFNNVPIGIPYRGLSDRVDHSTSKDIRKENKIANQNVYFIKQGEKIKIGVAFNPEDRMKQISVGNPDMKLLGYFPGSMDTEKDLHEEFRDFRIGNTEWFVYNDIIINKMNEQIGFFNTENTHNSWKEASKATGLGIGTIQKIKTIEEKASDRDKELLQIGKVSVDAIYKEIKKEEKIQEREKQIQLIKEEISTGKVKLPEGKYEVIVIDPPWEYPSEYNPESRRIASPYPEMSIEQIEAIELPASDNCVLWFWTTHKHIFSAKEILDKWGFEYKGILVWNKDKMGMGHWLRMQCEFCLLGVRGNPLWGITDWRDILTEGRREHSRKPESFYKMIEEKLIGRKLDYFSREQRNGWDSYGAEPEKF